MPSTEMQNPLLAEWAGALELPPFEAIRPAHFRPAFDRALADHRAEIDAIAENPAPADFENTIGALERSGRALERVASVFFVLAGADTSDEIEAIERDISPLLARHSNALYLNRALYSRIADLYDRRDTLSLDAEQARVLERYHTRFVRSGAALEQAGAGSARGDQRASGEPRHSVWPERPGGREVLRDGPRRGRPCRPAGLCTGGRACRRR